MSQGKYRPLRLSKELILASRGLIWPKPRFVVGRRFFDHRPERGASTRGRLCLLRRSPPLTPSRPLGGRADGRRGHPPRLSRRGCPSPRRFPSPERRSRRRFLSSPTDELWWCRSCLPSLCPGPLAPPARKNIYIYMYVYFFSFFYAIRTRDKWRMRYDEQG